MLLARAASSVRDLEKCIFEAEEELGQAQRHNTTNSKRGAFSDGDAVKFVK